MKLSTFFGGFIAILAIAYPLFVFWGLSYFSVRETALFLILVLALRIIVGIFTKNKNVDNKKHFITLLFMSLGFGIPVGIALGINSEFALRLMPAMINLSMLILFSSTLFSVPMIERFARMYAPKLSDAQKKHCLQFTKIWMIFFGINATIAFILCWAPRTWWTLYTGLVNYLVMGILFASEFIMRRFRFHEFTEHFYDRFLKHLFSLSTNRDLT